MAASRPPVIERLLTFEREISVIVVRGQNGEMKFYDPVENVHQSGILAISRVPARIHDDCAEEARGIAGKIAQALGHVGVLGVEMFQRGGDSPRDEVPRLIVNEIAPRVHNSGHWTTTPASPPNSRTTFAPSPAGGLAIRSVTAMR